MMDGYAVRAADTAGATREQPVRLRLVETIDTGRTPTTPVVAGTCAGIATGAPLPHGADAVVMVEHSASEGPSVLVFQPALLRQHVGRAGSDLVAGGIAVAEGTMLSPARLGVVAALGLDAVDVYQRPRVAILSTGDGIVAPGGSLGRRRFSTPTRLRLPPRFDCTAASRWSLRAWAMTAKR